MAKLMRSAGITAMLAAALTSVPAQAKCWRADEVRAAKVRDMETMLMVSALRCRTGADDFMARYNGFVVASRPALSAVNTTLRGHYEATMPKAAALNAYDKFVVRIANRYGGGVAGLDCADMASILEAVTNEGATLEAMAAVADRAAVEPILDEAACPLQVALTP